MAGAARPVSEFPLLDPPPRRWQGPIVDAHMHATDLASMRAYWNVAEELYGVTHAVVIATLETSIALRKVYGERVQPAVWGLRPRSTDLKDLKQFRKGTEAHLEKIAKSRMPMVKLWFTPRFLEWHNVRLDDPLLDFIFERIRKCRLGILIHVADPDYWFAHRINDLEVHGAKAEHYLQLTTRMEQFPEIQFQAAHFGGHPEDLDHLDDLFNRYPNLHVDSSATKWIAREFSNHGKQAQEFMIRNADRIVFGTDLVADPSKEKEGKREHYASRLYVHQLMWEGKGRFDSPIDDDDSPTPPRFRGLELPHAVLKKFYWGNAAKLFQLKPIG